MHKLNRTEQEDVKYPNVNVPRQIMLSCARERLFTIISLRINALLMFHLFSNGFDGMVELDFMS